MVSLAYSVYFGDHPPWKPLRFFHPLCFSDSQTGAVLRDRRAPLHFNRSFSGHIALNRYLCCILPGRPIFGVFEKSASRHLADMTSSSKVRIAPGAAVPQMPTVGTTVRSVPPSTYPMRI